MKLLRFTCPSCKTQVKCLSLGTSPVLWCLPHPSLAVFTQHTSGSVLINDFHAFLLSRWEPMKAQTLLSPCGGPNVWSMQAINEWESDWWTIDGWKSDCLTVSVLWHWSSTQNLKNEHILPNSILQEWHIATPNMTLLLIPSSLIRMWLQIC